MYIAILLHRHPPTRHTLPRNNHPVGRGRIGVGQILYGAAAIVVHFTTVAGVPRRAGQWSVRIRRHERRLGRFGTARDWHTRDFGRGFGHHRSGLVGFLARATAVPVARFATIELHQVDRIVGEIHTHLGAVVNVTAFLNEVVHVAIGSVIGEMTAIVHPRGAFEMLVVTGVVASVGATHCGIEKTSESRKRANKSVSGETGGSDETSRVGCSGCEIRARHFLKRKDQPSILIR